ncbi:two pore segment channel 3 isoform X1 [Scleropages formosus]|uniref:Two pore segment channel 3 n=2 Tax=Scleropages formosus TaxID=113540 RepID=A0A8C9T3I5_SCLFO|nr:two pore calcium channel protein 1-like isoform X1 [Scleropages formosus]
MSEADKREGADVGQRGANGGGKSSAGSAEGHKSDELKLAAVYVSDAQYNRNVFFNTSPQCVRLYMLYNHWSLQFLVYVFIFVDLALALFEDPAFVPLPLWATYIMELICLAAFTARLIHYARIIPKQKFWKDPKNICIVVVILLTLVDMIIYGSLKAMDYHVVRWSRVFRPLFLVNVTEGRHLRRAFRSIRNALPQIIYVFFLFIISVLMFSLMALKLFGKRDLKTIDGRSYFTNYGEIIFDLYVLVTTANSPDVMMPAYNSSSTFSIFFIVYILINTYTFMSVFLAVVYNNYKKYLKEEVRQLVRAKRQKMVRAFKVLQEMRDEEPVVMQACWNQLVCVVQPNITNAHRELLWSVSDENKRGYIGKMAFLQLPDLLNIQVITLKSRTHPLEIWIPRIYSSSASRLICRVVQHRAFVYIYDFIILVNAVFIGLDEENSFFSYAEWVFLGLYLLEILMKLYTFEPRAFYARHQFWNWFDSIIIVSALVATILNSVLKPSDGYNGRQILDIVFILRVLRLLRVVDSIKRFRAIINTLVKIGPTILTFGQLILVVYYIFAMVGMELFKGKITYFENSASPGSEYCGNPLLKGSAFAKNNYCKNNFNNVWSSFVLLVELTVVNQWHVLASGFTAVTNASARIFFVIFHILVVIIIINIFVAFVLEAFFVEYTFSKGELQTSLEKKIEELELGIEQDKLDENLVEDMETCENDLGPSETVKGKPSLMFKIASKRYRTVDGLLQRMFEADLSPEDNADDEDPDNESPPGYNFPNPSYDTI